MNYVDNTTVEIPWRKCGPIVEDWICLMKKINPQNSSDGDRSEWLEYLLSASKHYDVILDKNTVIFSDKE